MMKVALGMIIKDEMMFLNRHLHLFLPYFDGLIVVDGNSTDGTIEFLKEKGAVIIPQVEVDEVAGNDRSAVCKEAEKLGYDWVFMIDADEAMFPEAIKDVRLFMENPDNFLLLFPRIEFYGDANHYKPNLYPDYQGRAVRLNNGYHWRGAMHESVYKDDLEKSCWELGMYTIVPTAQIYHYGWALARERRQHKYFGKEANILPFVNDEGILIYNGRQPV